MIHVGITILIPDGETRTALAAARSLASAGFIATSEPTSHANISSASSTGHNHQLSRRMCSNVSFINRILFALRHEHFDVLLPITDSSTAEILQHEDEVRKQTSFPAVTLETFNTVSDKRRLVGIAASLGICVPKTLLVSPLAEQNEHRTADLDDFPYPAVLKPAQAVNLVGSSGYKPLVRYPRNAGEVHDVLRGCADPRDTQIPFLFQELITGTGVGYFALCRDGRPLVELRISAFLRSRQREA